MYLNQFCCLRDEIATGYAHVFLTTIDGTQYCASMLPHFLNRQVKADTSFSEALLIRNTFTIPVRLHSLILVKRQLRPRCKGQTSQTHFERTARCIISVNKKHDIPIQYGYLLVVDDIFLYLIQITCLLKLHRNRRIRGICPTTFTYLSLTFPNYRIKPFPSRSTLGH